VLIKLPKSWHAKAKRATIVAPDLRGSERDKESEDDAKGR
jgi:hypothetical protein